MSQPGHFPLVADGEGLFRYASLPWLIRIANRRYPAFLLRNTPKTLIASLPVAKTDGGLVFKLCTF